jgi:hypothetical protein
MIKKLLNLGFCGKLQNALQGHIKSDPFLKPEVMCWLTPSVSGTRYHFNARLGTSLPHGPFYTSKEYHGLREALLALTSDVAESSRLLPNIAFFRGIQLCSRALVCDYLLHYGTIEDRHAWLTRATTCSPRDQKYKLIEVFDGESWKPASEQSIETSDLHPRHVQYVLENAFHPLICFCDSSEDESGVECKICDSGDGRVLFNIPPTPFFLLQRREDLENTLRKVRAQIQKDGVALYDMNLDFEDGGWLDEYD